MDTSDNMLRPPFLSVFIDHHLQEPSAPDSGNSYQVKA
jgi:hypothetical protein